MLVLGKEHKSSLFRAHVENMVCLFNATGKTMLETGRRQAENFGNQFIDTDILKITADKDRFVLGTESGIQLICKALIIDDGTTLSASGVFIELGAKGLMELATSLGVALDDSMRFIRTDKAQRTSVPGIFAAGDICGPPWQVAKAVGEGCVAGLNAANYAKKL